MVKISIKKTRRNLDGFLCLEEALKGGDNSLPAVVGRLIVRRTATFLPDVNTEDQYQSDD
jgi:hypothetical protein